MPETREERRIGRPKVVDVAKVAGRAGATATPTATARAKAAVKPTAKKVAPGRSAKPAVKAPRAQSVNGSADAATRQRVIDAAVACILERGFYRASSNEIARRAGVTWGVIQHYFGTRDRLMLAVLEHGAHTFTELVAGHHITGDTTTDRVEDLLDVLSQHYAVPAYLAHLQVLLNLDHDPSTSVEVRKTMHEVAVQSFEHVRRLIGETLGAPARESELGTTILLALRGFALSQVLLETQSYDLAPQATSARRTERQRQLLAEIIGSYVDKGSRR